jgi:hypothetical protein
MATGNLANTLPVSWILFVHKEERLTIHNQRVKCELRRASCGVGLESGLSSHPLQLGHGLISSEMGGYGSMYIVIMDGRYWSADERCWT